MGLLLGDVVLDPEVLTLLLIIFVLLTAVPCIVVLRGPMRWLTALAVTSALVLVYVFLLPTPSTDAKLALCAMYLLVLFSLSFAGAAYMIIRRRAIKTPLSSGNSSTNPDKSLLTIYGRPHVVRGMMRAREKQE